MQARRYVLAWGDVDNGLRIRKSRYRYLPACIRCRAFVCITVNKCRNTTLNFFTCYLAYRMDLNRGHRVYYPIEASTRLGLIRWFERMSLYYPLQFVVITHALKMFLEIAYGQLGPVLSRYFIIRQAFIVSCCFQSVRA